MTAFPARRFLHIGINPRQPMITGQIHASIQQFLNQVDGDWYRYASQNYVVWTNWAIADVAAGITRMPGLQNLYLLATEFQPLIHTCNGMMPQEFWQWLYKTRY